MAVPRLRGIARRAGLAVLVVALVLAVALGGLAAWLHSDAGRARIAALIEGAVSDDTVRLAVGGLEGDLLSDFTLRGLAASDRDGVFVTVDRVRVSWKPWSLLGGVVEIAAIEAGRVAVERLPAAEGGGGGSGTAPPDLALVLRRLAVAEIALAQPVAGAAQRLSLLGAVNVAPRFASATVDLDLQRIDGAAGRARLALDYAAAPARFGARVSVEEPPGGLVARLAGLPPETGLAVNLEGGGPPDAWRGRLTASAGTLAHADLAVTVSVATDGMAVGLAGRIDAAGLLPEALAPLAAHPFDVQASLRSDLRGMLAVESARAANPAVEVSGHFRLDAAGALGGEATATLPDAAALATLAGGASAGRTTLSATLSGTLQAPRLAAEMATERISVEGFGAETLRGRIEAAPSQGGAWDVGGSFSFAALAPPSGWPPGLIGKDATVELQASALPTGDVPILVVSIDSGPSRASFDGALAGAALDGQVEFALADLSPLARAQGIAAGGSVALSGTVRADMATGAASLTVAGTATGLSGPRAAVLDAIGRRATFAFALATKDGDALAVSGVSVETRAGRLTGAATLGLGSGRIDGRFAAEVPDAAVLSALAGVAVAGRLRATATVEGALDAPAVTARIETEGARIEDTALGAVGIGIGARIGADRIAARLSAAANVMGRKLDAKADATLRGDTLDVREVAATFGGARLTGAMRADLASGRMSGAASVEVRDLADLSDVAGVALSGTAAARLRMADAARQEIVVEATADGVGAALGPGVTADRVRLSATVADPFGRPTLTAALEAAPVAAGTASLTRAKLTASGGRDSLAWSVETEGSWSDKVTVSAAGDLALAASGGSLTLRKFDGSYGGRPVALAAPANVEWAGDELTAGPVDLAVAGGRLTGRAALARGTIDAEASVESLPARLIALAVPDADVEGTVAARVRASGPLARPVLDAELAVSALRPAGLEEPGDGVELRATLHQTDGGMQLGGDAKGPDGLSASLELAVSRPVRFDGAGPPVDATAALSGRVRAATELGLVDRLVGLGGDRLAGRLDAEVAIGGTVAAPALRGEARLAGGAYEGASTGILVRALEAVVAFEGERARIVSLTARDGGTGRLGASGAIDFSADGPAEDRLKVRLDEFVALRRPEATLTVTGDIAAAGPVAKPAVSGVLTVERGEIRIPDRLPVSVVELDVVEINKPPGAAAPRAERSASRALAASLDVRVSAPGRVFVRGRGLDAELQGDLHVTGTTAAPVVQGALTIVRGTFAFAGHTFKLSEGTLRFPEDGPPDPEIDLVARAQLPDLVAIARISGTPSQISIAVTSEPEMPQEEVLSRILFGRNAGQLSPIQAAQLASTAATLSGGGGPGIMDRIRRTLGVDVLNVESDGADGKGASLKAGKYLTDDVFLSVRQGTEPGSQRVGVEVEVMPNVSVESDVGGSGQTGLGINWKWDY